MTSMDIDSKVSTLPMPPSLDILKYSNMTSGDRERSQPSGVSAGS